MPAPWVPRGARTLSRQDPGDVVRVGGRRGHLDDLYHFLLKASWARVIGLVASLYLVFNVLFAGLYLLGGRVAGDCIAGAEHGSFSDAFFFSVQTFSTIGYGTMSPKNGLGSAIVTLEAFFGLVAVAMATGLMFAKFSRPTSRVLFSDKMVIAPRDGKPTLMFRVANERGNDVIEAAFKLTVLKPEISAEGERMRRLHDVRLVRGDTPLFTLAFQGMHTLDETSPLHGMTHEQMCADQIRFILTVTGLDSTFASTIHARYVYYATDIVPGVRFADVIENRDDGKLVIDLGKFHDVVPA
jgi:inward rectifier potassium channel